MNLKDFQNECLTQKNVLTMEDKIFGGQDDCCGTNTSYTERTANLSGWAMTFAQLAGVDDDHLYSTDEFGDWNDEGCC